MNLEQFSTDLNTALQNCINTFNGSVISDELIDTMTTQLNAAADSVYQKYNLPDTVHVTREFTNYLIETLVATGRIKLIQPVRTKSSYNHMEDVTPTDPLAHSATLLDDMNQYDPKDKYSDLIAHINETIKNIQNPTKTSSEGDRFIGMHVDDLDSDLDLSNNKLDTLAEDEKYANSLPEGWGNELCGNFDAQYWAQQFKVMAELRPSWVKDEGYLIEWFANAIMAGYDKAKQEEFPIQEKNDTDYIFLEFYDIDRDVGDTKGNTESEITEMTLKFQTLAAAQEFVKLNAYGTNFKSKYYRYYEFKPEIFLKKVDIK